MADWGYVIAGFAAFAGALAGYAVVLERRLARLRPTRRRREKR